MVQNPGMEPRIPTEHESVLALDCMRKLLLLKGDALRVRLSDSEAEMVLPASAVRLLVDLLAETAAGHAVVVTSYPAELGTQQAADLLGVSRPFLDQKLKAGTIPFRRVGTRRRIQFADLMKYKHEVDRKRHAALDELTAQAQKLDLGY